MATKIYIPNIGDNELEVTDIMVNIGDTVHIDQPLIILEGDKLSTEVPSPHAGILKSILIKIGDKVKTGSLIMLIEHIEKKEKTINISNINKNQNKKYSLNETYNQNNQSTKNNSDNVHATPLVRHMARTFGINLEKVQGTGRRGRILREDIQNYIKNNIQNIESHSTNQKISQIALNIPSWPKINFEKFGDIDTIELQKIQKISGRNLHRNWITVPHVTQFEEIDITELEKFRKEKNKEAEEKQTNVKITPIIFIIKAVAKALEMLPQFNSSVSNDGEKLILKKYINIGIAVNTQHGLIVPVIRDINKKNIITLTKELGILLQKAYGSKNQLTPSDTQGGCFTISSLGKIGGTAFTPIVNVPEVAILGVSKLSIKPIWNGKKFIPRTMLPLSLSYDHRIINGVDGAEFMQIINNILSDIRNLIL